MANPELSQRIQALPEELLDLEREPGTAERLRRIDALKDRARALEPLDGVEDMALEDYDRDWLVRYTYNSNAIEGSTLTLEDTSLVLEGEFRHGMCSPRAALRTAWPTCANTPGKGGDWMRSWSVASTR